MSCVNTIMLLYMCVYSDSDKPFIVECPYPLLRLWGVASPNTHPHPLAEEDILSSLSVQYDTLALTSPRWTGSAQSISWSYQAHDQPMENEYIVNKTTMSYIYIIYYSYHPHHSLLFLEGNELGSLW